MEEAEAVSCLPSFASARTSYRGMADLRCGSWGSTRLLLARGGEGSNRTNLKRAERGNSHLKEVSRARGGSMKATAMAIQRSSLLNEEAVTREQVLQQSKIASKRKGSSEALFLPPPNAEEDEEFSFVSSASPPRSSRASLLRSSRQPEMSEDEEYELDSIVAAAEALEKGVRRRTKKTQLEEVEALDEQVEGSGSNALEQQGVANPFKGLHEQLRRSYRLDEVLAASRPEELVLAKQEPSAAVFSFLSLNANLETYKHHWEAKSALRAQHDPEESIWSADELDSEEEGQRKHKSRGKKQNNFKTEALAVRDAVEEWGGLGWQNLKIDVDYNLLVAQRLLLFPPALRHFHVIAGRIGVPCDFYADMDLADTTLEDAEKTLVEVLDYLEVRLPGVGFTDPFFMVLTNEDPGELLASSSDGNARSKKANRSASKSRKEVRKKISYHIHARSMTHIQLRAETSMAALRKALKRQKRALKASRGEDDEALMEAAEDTTSSKGKAKSAAAESASSKPSRAAIKTIAFQDFRSVKLIADEVNQTLGFTAIDEGCYRMNGSIRCAFSRKIPPNITPPTISSKKGNAGAGETTDGDLLGLQPALIPLPIQEDQNAELKKKLESMHDVLSTLTAPEILELTFCTRHLPEGGAPMLRVLHDHLAASLLTHPQEGDVEAIFKTISPHRFKLVKPVAILGPQGSVAADGTGRGEQVEYDAYGNPVSPYLTEPAKWRRYKTAIQKLQSVPPRAAENFDTWVRIGLALHNFSNEEHVFEEWVRFSLKCPQKYSRDACRKKWLQFERNPDALNWRRGFNYLNSTLWRQI